MDYAALSVVLVLFVLLITYWGKMFYDLGFKEGQSTRHHAQGETGRETYDQSYPSSDTNTWAD